MRIEAVEIRNFRKLLSVRLDLSEGTTLLVGANNSGKTSALIALRSFLKDGIRAFDKNDLTLSHWAEINEIGLAWVASDGASTTQPGTWDRFLPTLDVWLRVEDVEAHRVSTLIPTLDWSGGLVGVRIALEPDDEVELIRSFREAWSASHALTDEWRATQVSGASQAVEKGDESSAAEDLSLWPKDLIDFLARNFQKYMNLRYYVLDPSQFRDPENDVARIQDLSPSVEPLSSNPLEHIVRIDEINAQRGLSDASESTSDGTTRRISDTADL